MGKPPIRIELRAGGAPVVRKKRRSRTDSRQFAEGMFKMYAGQVRPMGLSIRFDPEAVFGPTSPTSMRRRWSQLTGKPMKRWEKGNHPRPWEGPREQSAARWISGGWTYRRGRR